MRKVILLFFISVLVFGGSSHEAAGATYTVDFEGAGETKIAYAIGNVSLTGIQWTLDSVLIGTTASDRKNGIRSARFVNKGIMTMVADKANGAGTITLNHALWGTDPSSTWMLEVSNDGGASWNAFVSPIVTSTDTLLTTQSFTANVIGNIRVRISKLSGGANNRINIDDISITDYTVGNTTTCSPFAGSPFCITNSTGATFNVNFTSTGTFFPFFNDYTAQLSDATGSFSIPINIGTLSSSANSGAISVTIPAGTPTGSGYKIRITSSSPSSGLMTASPAFSIFLNTPDVTGASGSAGNTTVTVSWTNPTGCFDNIMVVAQANTSITAVPTIPVYGASATYGLGAAFGTGYVVYFLPSGTNVTISSLINGTLYFFKIFTIKNGIWSSGVEVSATPTNINIGDYRSRASGNWKVNTTWEKCTSVTPITWTACAPLDWPNVGAAAGSASTINVTLKSPYTVSLNNTSTPNQAINNLTVEAGAKLTGGTLAGNWYLTIYGNITNYGTIGSNLSTEGISFNIEGTNSTISGTGTFDASRIRKQFATNPTTNLIIAATAINLYFSSGSGTPLYNNSSGTFNLTLNQNSVLSLMLNGGTSANASINGQTGGGIGDGTYTINGTMNVPGILYALTTNTLPGRACRWIIGNTGVINCNQINVGPSGASTHTFTILNGGRLNINSNNLGGTPFFPFSTTNSTFDCQPGSFVEYSSTTGVQVIEPQIIYSNLVLSNASDKTVAANLKVNGDLNILGGTLQPGANTIFLGGDWNNYSTAGFTEATSKVIFQGSVLQTIYSAGGEDFYDASITNSTGVTLADNITVSDILDLTTTGKLIFGAAQRIVTLSNMNAIDAFRGSGSAGMDLTNSNHYLYIGSLDASYSGSFNAGTQSFVVYNRSKFVNGLGANGGDQNINMNIVYANLSMIGTDNKYTNNNFNVGVDMVVDGAITIMHGTALGKTLTLAGNLTLSGGAVMNDNCRDNLSILTSGNNLQTFNANFDTVKCFDLLSTKVSGGISLSSGATTVDIKRDLKIDYATTALFSDNLNLIKVGDDAELGGTSSTIANYSLTGTLEFDAIGATTDLHLSNVLSTGLIRAELNNLTINTGVQTGALKIVEVMPSSGGQPVVIKGNVTIIQGTNGGEFDANANNLKVGGNWSTYDQTGFDETGSSVMFNGTTLQTISATVLAAFEQFDNMKVNNTSTGVQLLAPVQTKTLNLQLGELDLNSNRLTIANPLTTAITGGSNSTYIKSETALGGPLLATNPSIVQWNVATSTGVFVFPFGVAGTYIPLTINKLNTTTANLEVATRATTPDNLPWDDATNVAAVNNMFYFGTVGVDGSVPVVIDRWWDINTSVDGVLADITFSYRGSENTLTGGNATGAIAAQNWDGAFWGPPVCSSCNNGVTVGTGTVVASGVGLGSTPWVLSGQSAPLPVELLSFTAQKINDNDALCKWSTASEINNDRFIVESASDQNNYSGELKFQEIGSVKGSGNSTTLKEYSFTDARPNKIGNYYYRLRQVDFDGKYSYSNIAVVKFSTGNNLMLVNVSPNPFSEKSFVNVMTRDKGTIRFSLTDALGRIMNEQSVYSLDGVSTFVVDEKNEMKPGIYFACFVFNGEMVVKKLLKQ